MSRKRKKTFRGEVPGWRERHKWRELPFLNYKVLETVGSGFWGVPVSFAKLDKFARGDAGPKFGSAIFAARRASATRRYAED